MVSERVIPVSLAPRHELVRAWLTGVRFEALEMAFVRSVARRPLSQARRHRQDWRVTVRLAGPLAGRRVTDQAGPDDEAAAMTAWRRWRERLTITL
jgi:hypothetical protein